MGDNGFELPALAVRHSNGRVTRSPGVGLVPIADSGDFYKTQLAESGWDCIAPGPLTRMMSFMICAVPAPISKPRTFAEPLLET